MKLEPKNESLLKTYLVYFLSLVFGIAIIVKIALVMTKESKELVPLAEQREYRIRELEASRGNIFSADGNLMATSVPVFDIFFDTKTVDENLFASEIDSLSSQLAALRPIRNADQWRKYLCDARAEGKRYLPIAKNIPLKEYRQL